MFDYVCALQFEDPVALPGVHGHDAAHCSSTAAQRAQTNITNRGTSMKVVLVVLAFLAFLAAAFGALSLSNATMGVGFICLGCLAAVGARIAQASAHHTELLKRMAN